MITPSFGLTATERVLPKLALDFTTGLLDARVTFTRTTGASNPATYVNSSGYVTAATNNQPRFDYDPVTLVCKGLLIEESRSNLCVYSEEFDNAAWNTQNSGTGSLPVVTANAAVAPDGNTTADKIVFNAGAGTSSGDLSLIRGANITTTAISYATTIYLKGEVGGEQIMIQGPSNSGYTLLTLTTSWQRFTLVETGFASTGYKMNFGVRQGIGGIGTINANPTIYAWGAQLEAGAFATSYIPTTTAALTRNADVATMTGTNFSDWWNDAEGAFISSAVFKNVLSAGRSPFSVATGVTTASGLSITTDAGNNRWLYRVFDSANTAVGAVNYTAAGTPVADVEYNIALSYKTDSYKIAINANSVTTDGSGTKTGTPDICYIGRNQTGTTYANGWISNLRYFDQQLTDNELIAFSK